MKISFFSFACNTNFPLDIMYRQFQKYMKEDFEFTLFNDAYIPQMEKDINTICEFNKIPCVRVPQSVHKVQNPSVSYAETLNWAVWEYAVKNNCEIVVLMHSDVFPICDVNVSDILGDAIVASTPEFRIVNGKGVNYFYPALTAINMIKLTNPKELNFLPCPGLDTGGRTQEFIKKYPNDIKYIPNHQIEYFIRILDKDPMAEYYKEDLVICIIAGLSAVWCAEGFLHYLCGSQWNSDNLVFAEGHRLRSELFLKYFY